MSTRTLVAVCGALLAVLVAGFAWVGVRAYLAKGELEALVPVAGDLVDAADARDLDRLGRAADTLASHASAAWTLTRDPAWGVAQAMPVLGPNFGAVRTVAANLSAVSTSAVGPMLELAADVQHDDDTEADGFDLALVERAQQPLAGAASALATADRELSGIHGDQLLAPLADGVSRLSSAIAQASPLVTSLSRAAEVLPGILGAEGARSILFVLQNPAEPRTGGGVTGAFALLEADDGRLSLVAQADSGVFPGRAEPIVPIPDSTVALYGDVVGRFVPNTSMPADFTLAARLASAWWQEHSGTAPDAVVSLDPRVLAALLEVTGPVTLADGSEVDSANLVQRVAVDAYFELDRDAQTEFQQGVTQTVLSHVMSGGIDILAWIEALAPVIDEGRLSVWSAHDDEQRLLADGALAGPAARHTAAGADGFALYLNDATAGKMGIFLEADAGIGSVECRPDGRRDVVVRVLLTNIAPADAGAEFPWWVTGGGLEGTEPGHIALDVTVAAPPGSFFGGVTRDGELAPSTNVVDAGFPSSLARVDIAPGGTTVVEARFTMADPRDVAPVLLTTPLLRDVSVDDAFSAACAG
nr:DUF4012 domain-containing protein [Microbacterium ulmi]